MEEVDRILYSIVIYLYSCLLNQCLAVMMYFDVTNNMLSSEGFSLGRARVIK